MASEACLYHSKWIAESPERYQPLTRERLIQAGDMKATVYADALRQTNLLRRELQKTFSSVDLLISPTMPRLPETFAESKNFDQFGLQNTSPFDVFGLPTISVPCGFSKSGVP